MSAGDPPVQQRARETFELFEVVVSLVRARLRRDHAEATDHELDVFVREWLVHGSGGALGDPPPAGLSTRRTER